MNILYISYFFPPLGGPAAIRNTKTVKYLSKAGAKVHVITVEDIEYAYRDPKLGEEVQAYALQRVPSLDPMALLRKIFGNKHSKSQFVYKRSPERLKLLIRRLYPIDEKIGWLPGLLKAGRNLLANQTFDFIYVSCGPFSSAVGAYKLAEEFKIKLVVDYRDYWTLLSDYDLMGNALKRWHSHRWERRIIKRADLLVCATKGIRDSLAESFDPTILNRSLILYNGHDEEDFKNITHKRPSGEFFSLAYFGNIYARRSLKYLYAAILELEREHLIPQKLRVLLYGNFNREVHDEVAHSGIEERIIIMPQLTHRKALSAMQEADALVLAINGSSPKGTLTSKIFEYLRLGKSILALVPPSGEAAELLKECGISSVCAMESISQIKNCLSCLFDNFGTEPGVSPALYKYERSSQVLALYQKLTLLVENNSNTKE